MKGLCELQIKMESVGVGDKMGKINISVFPFVSVGVEEEMHYALLSVYFSSWQWRWSFDFT